MRPFQQYTLPIFHQRNGALMVLTAIAGILEITLQVCGGDDGGGGGGGGGYVGTKYSHTPHAKNKHPSHPITHAY